MSSASEIGKFILTTPGVPADRVAALREAFDAMVKDPEFLAEATKLRIEIDPLAGVELQKIVQRDPGHPARRHREGQGDLSAELTRPLIVANARCCALAPHSPSQTGVNALLLGRGLHSGSTQKNG